MSMVTVAEPGRLKREDVDFRPPCASVRSYFTPTGTTKSKETGGGVGKGAGEIIR